MPYFWCRKNVGSKKARGRGGKKVRQKIKCHKKLAWHGDAEFGQQMPRLAPTELLQLVWHWGMEHSRAETAFETGISPTTITNAFHFFSDTVCSFMMKLTDATQKIGGLGRIVCLDSTRMTKKKKNKGGFQGRVTAGQELIIYGGVELNGPWAGSKETGRAFLVEIGDESELTYRALIDRNGETLGPD